MQTTRRSSIRFGQLTIDYDERVLAPRAWTELQSHWAAELVGPGDGAVLELCTGAGHIGLLAAALTGRDLVAVDIDPVACEWARSNAERAGLSQRVTVRESPLAEALGHGECFDLAIADPPWVRTARIGTFPEDPVLAIDGGSDGLSVARQCVRACRDHLVPGASLLVQLGDPEQAQALTRAAVAEGWAEGELRPGARGVVQQLLHP